MPEKKHSLRKRPLAFISYRRADSSAASRWLADTIARTFGASSVFIDTESIRAGDKWRKRIDDSLRSATLLLPMIGPSWLEIKDERGQRRLTRRDDWVRKEIQHALNNEIAVIPILLSKAPIPSPSRLPNSIAALVDCQGFELRDNQWDNDRAALLKELERHHFRRQSPRSIRYPTPRLTLRELTRAELAPTLKAGWREVSAEIPGNEEREGQYLYREYEFSSFEDAMNFMAAATPKVSKMDHHPYWENIWRTVSVWLSTWDIGHRPSILDVKLAAHLDRLRSNYPRSQPKKND